MHPDGNSYGTKYDTNTRRRTPPMNQPSSHFIALRLAIFASSATHHVMCLLTSAACPLSSQLSKRRPICPHGFLSSSRVSICGDGLSPSPENYVNLRLVDCEVMGLHPSRSVPHAPNSGCVLAGTMDGCKLFVNFIEFTCLRRRVTYLVSYSDVD